jgi:hypothetical protein
MGSGACVRADAIESKPRSAGRSRKPGALLVAQSESRWAEVPRRPEKAQ